MAQYCCKWNDHFSNLLTGMENFKIAENYVDVTLICEGQAVKVHKIVLASFSKLFHDMFLSNPCTHPIILLQDMKFPILQAIVNFMYRGEISVQQDDLELLLKAAKALGVKGLSDICKEVLFGSLVEDMVQASQNDASINNFSDSEPAKKRPRTQSSDLNISGDGAYQSAEYISEHPEAHVEANPPAIGLTLSVISNSSLASAYNQVQSTTPSTPSKKNAATSYEINPSPGKPLRFKMPPQKKKVNATSEEGDGSSGGKKRSFIWKFFTPLNDSIAECNSCLVTKSYKSSTSNLKKHLKAKHPSFELFYGPFKDNHNETEEHGNTLGSAQKAVVPCENPDYIALKECISRRKTSPLWKYFTRKNRVIAQCNICLLHQSYRSSISNLKKHLERKHPSIDLLQCSDDSTEAPVEPSTVAVMPQSSKPTSPPFKKQSCKQKGQKTSYLWNFFTPLDNFMAECNICLKSKCYKSSITNLKKHLIQKHPSLDLQSAQDLQDLAERNRYQDQIVEVESETAVMNIESTGEVFTEELQTETDDYAKAFPSVKKFEKRKKSFLWNFFEPIDEYVAVCKICSVNKSYRSSTSNLKKHLERAHPSTMIRNSVQLLNFTPRESPQTITEVEVEEDRTYDITDDNLQEIVVETRLMPEEGSSSTPIVLKL